MQEKTDLKERHLLASCRRVLIRSRGSEDRRLVSSHASNLISYGSCNIPKEKQNDSQECDQGQDLENESNGRFIMYYTSNSYQSS